MSETNLSELDLMFIDSIVLDVNHFYKNNPDVNNYLSEPYTTSGEFKVEFYKKLVTEVNIFFIKDNPNIFVCAAPISTTEFTIGCIRNRFKPSIANGAIHDVIFHDECKGLEEFYKKINTP